MDLCVAGTVCVTEHHMHNSITLVKIWITIHKLKSCDNFRLLSNLILLFNENSQNYDVMCMTRSVMCMTIRSTIIENH